MTSSVIAQGAIIITDVPTYSVLAVAIANHGDYANYELQLLDNKHFSTGGGPHQAS